LRREPGSIIRNVHWRSPLKAPASAEIPTDLLIEPPRPHLQKFGAGALVVAAG
jgi:hypothetical protein